MKRNHEAEGPEACTYPPAKKAEHSCQPSPAVLQWPCAAAAKLLKRRTCDDALQHEEVSPKRARATIRCAGISDDKENYSSDDSPIKVPPLVVTQPRPPAVVPQGPPSSLQCQAYQWRTPPPLHKAGARCDTSPTHGLPILSPSSMDTCPQTIKHRAEDPSFSDWVTTTPGGTRSSLLATFGSLGVDSSAFSQRSNPVYAMTGANRRGTALPKCPSTPPQASQPQQDSTIGSGSPARPGSTRQAIPRLQQATTSQSAAHGQAGPSAAGASGSSVKPATGGPAAPRAVNTTQASLHNFLRRVPAAPHPLQVPHHPPHPSHPHPSTLPWLHMMRTQRPLLTQPRPPRVSSPAATISSCSATSCVLDTSPHHLTTNTRISHDNRMTYELAGQPEAWMPTSHICMTTWMRLQNRRALVWVCSLLQGVRAEPHRQCVYVCMCMYRHSALIGYEIVRQVICAHVMTVRCGLMIAAVCFLFNLIAWSLMLGHCGNKRQADHVHQVTPDV